MTFKTSFIINSSVLTVLVLLFSSFTISNEIQHQLNDYIMADNYCTLYLTTSYDSPAKDVKVSTDVSGGLSCVGGRSFYTDKAGKVELKWSKGCNLKKVYVKGKGYNVDFRNGETYYLKIR
jgi:hypothetical protein